MKQHEDSHCASNVTFIQNVISFGYIGFVLWNLVFWIHLIKVDPAIAKSKPKVEKPKHETSIIMHHVCAVMRNLMLIKLRCSWHCDLCFGCIDFTCIVSCVLCAEKHRSLKTFHHRQKHKTNLAVCCHAQFDVNQIALQLASRFLCCLNWFTMHYIMCGMCWEAQITQISIARSRPATTY